MPTVRKTGARVFAGKCSAPPDEFKPCNLESLRLRRVSRFRAWSDSRSWRLVRFSIECLSPNRRSAAANFANHSRSERFLIPWLHTAEPKVLSATRTPGASAQDASAPDYAGCCVVSNWARYSCYGGTPQSALGLDDHLQSKAQDPARQAARLARLLRQPF